MEHHRVVSDHKPAKPIKLHSSIHDDQPCECLSCRNLRAVIQRYAQSQSLMLPRH